MQKQTTKTIYFKQNNYYMTKLLNLNIKQRVTYKHTVVFTSIKYKLLSIFVGINSFNIIRTIIILNKT